MELTKDIQKSKNLVYTSAGDRSNVPDWIAGERDFDLWITYYGSDKRQLQRFEKIAQFVNQRKGSKFQNLFNLYINHQDVLSQYDHIFILDDDLIISTESLNEVFSIHKKYNLSISQPAFDRAGKVSHKITAYEKGTVLRYTNFVEVTCPLFTTEVLFDFFGVYDTDLVGWGIDWWFTDKCINQSEEEMAIIDAVICLNPTDEMKGGIREIDTLQPIRTRKKMWRKIKQKYNIRREKKGLIQFGEVLS